MLYFRNATHARQELQKMFTDALRRLSTINLIFYSFNNNILDRLFNTFEPVGMVQGNKSISKKECSINENR